MELERCNRIDILTCFDPTWLLCFLEMLYCYDVRLRHIHHEHVCECITVHGLPLGRGASWAVYLHMNIDL